MWIEETRWTPEGGWGAVARRDNGPADLVMYFGNNAVLRRADLHAELRGAYPTATIIGCSATHSVRGDAFEEDGIVATALGFARTPIRMARHDLRENSGSRAAGEAIGAALAADDLAGILVFADGLRVDGSELTAALNAAVGTRPLIVGGMASDSGSYHEVLVGADCAPRSGMIVAVGFYGDSIRLTHGCASGFDAFGPRRRISRSAANVIYELDGKSPLDLYRRYLGEEISLGISREGATYPLLIWPPEHPDRTLVRAPVAADEAGGSMTFAGHVPEGWIARLMRGNADRLILGAADAARRARAEAASESLGLIVSCAGRQQMMGQRTEEELEVVATELGRTTKCIGFYSYGEIAPLAHSGVCALHNETMTITTLFEAADCAAG